MHLIRGLAGTLLLILSAVLGLVALVLCITVILLPLGLPLLAYAGRLLASALKLMAPRSVSHPVKTFRKPLSQHGHHLKKEVSGLMPSLKKMRKRSHKKVRRMRKRAPLFS